MIWNQAFSAMLPPPFRALALHTELDAHAEQNTVSGAWMLSLLIAGKASIVDLSQPLLAL